VSDVSVGGSCLLLVVGLSVASGCCFCLSVVFFHLSGPSSEYWSSVLSLCFISISHVSPEPICLGTQPLGNCSPILIFLCNFPNMFLSAHTFHIGANTVLSATTQQKMMYFYTEYLPVSSRKTRSDSMFKFSWGKTTHCQ
jgi:hypothetical protein